MKYLRKFPGEEEYEEYINNPEEVDIPHIGMIESESRKLMYQPTCKFGYTIQVNYPHCVDLAPPNFYEETEGGISERKFYNNTSPSIYLQGTENQDGDNSGEGDYTIELPGFRFWADNQRYNISSTWFSQSINSFNNVNINSYYPSLSEFLTLPLSKFKSELNPELVFFNILYDIDPEDAAEYDVWGYSLGNAAINQWLIDNDAENDSKFLEEHYVEATSIYCSPISLATQNYLSSHTLAEIASQIEYDGNYYDKVSPYVIGYLGLTQWLHPTWSWADVVSWCWENHADNTMYWAINCYLNNIFWPEYNNEPTPYGNQTLSVFLTPDNSNETYLASIYYLLENSSSFNLESWIYDQIREDDQYSGLSQEEFNAAVNNALDNYIRTHLSASDTLEERKTKVVQIIAEMTGVDYVSSSVDPITAILVDGKEIETQTELTVSLSGEIINSESSGNTITPARGKTEIGGSSSTYNFYGNALYVFSNPGKYEITLIMPTLIKSGNYFSDFSNLPSSVNLIGVKYPHTWETIDLNELGDIPFSFPLEETQIVDWGEEGGIRATRAGGNEIKADNLIGSEVINSYSNPVTVEYGETINNIIQTSIDASHLQTSATNTEEVIKGGTRGTTSNDLGIFSHDIDLIVKDRRYRTNSDANMLLMGNRLELVYGSKYLTSLPKPSSDLYITSISPNAFPNCKIEVNEYKIPEGITTLEPGSLHHICLTEGFVLTLPSTLKSLGQNIFHPDSSNHGIVIFRSYSPPTGFDTFLGTSGNLYYIPWYNTDDMAYEDAIYEGNYDYITLTWADSYQDALESLRYLNFDIYSSGTITLSYTGGAPTGSSYFLSYKLNDNDWIKLTGSNITNLSLEVKAGDHIIWESNALRGFYYSGYKRSKFNATCEFRVYGTLNSLMYSSSNGKKITEVPRGGFYELFKDCTGLTSAKDLSLPSSLNSNGYNFYGMFQGCTALKDAPDISVSSAETYAFSNMFTGCTSLSYSPTISATTLKTNSCYYMFSNCTGLEEAGPINVSGTLELNACYYMFNGCTNLEVTPEIVVGTIAENAFMNSNTFYGCSSLMEVSPITATTVETYGLYNLFNYAKNELTSVGNITITNTGNYALASLFSGCSNLTSVGKITITNAGDSALSTTFQNCTELVSPPQISIANLSASCCHQLFKGCINLTTAPELPATTLADYCYNGMFQGCTSLTAIPELPATTLEQGCYASMFLGCTSLGTIPELPATTLAENCYFEMFSGCTSLTTTPELPALQVLSYSYSYMFYGCTSLTTISTISATSLAGEEACSHMFEGCTSLITVPTLSTTTLALRCYESMFQGCTALVNAPSLPATTLVSQCYKNMFSGCTALTQAPNLPATTLVQSCYYGMFQGCTSLTTLGTISATTQNTESCREMFKGCTSLTTAPNLSATTLGERCYYGMFEGCTNLTQAPVISATTLATGCCISMFKNCTSLVQAPNLSATTLANSCYGAINGSYPGGTNYGGMFEGCTSLTTVPNLPATTLAQNCYAGMFKGCTALVTAPTILATTMEINSCTGMFEGCTALTTVPSISATTLAQYCCNQMFKGCTSLTTTPQLLSATLAPNCYQNMFQGCTSLTTIPNLAATTLASNCYSGMFTDCTSLTQAPTLPITDLANFCYSGMFTGCTSLTALPTLPATTLAQGCYKNMFKGCTGLVSVPTNYLPVTTLAESCYAGMFQNCTSLTQAPNLPATTLAPYCYGSNDSGGAPTGMNGMFRGCTSLTTAPNLPATTLANYCYCGMFYGCTALVNAPTISGTILANYCYSYMFYGCTSLTQAPQLPVTTLANYCYYYMFSGCSSLTTAPELPATTLVQGCYSQMFSHCTTLNYIKMLATSISVSSCLTSWVYNVPSGGTFVMNGEAMWYSMSESGIPSGWEIQYDGDSTVAEDYINTIRTGYFCSEAIEDGTFTLTIPNYVGTSYVTSISYSLDEGQTWTTGANVNNSTVTITTPTVQAGNKVYWKGTGSKFCANSTSSSYRCTFSSTGRFNVSGYIMSLLNGDGNYVDLTVSINNYTFPYLFYNNTKIVSAENLKLPKTTNTYCYYYMFYGCTSLTTAPTLPAPNLSTNCYNYMFYNCYNLNYVKALFTMTPGSSYTYNWMYGVKSSGTFVKHTNATWTTSGNSGVPSGWTIERASE